EHQLASRHPKDQSIEDRHPLGAPSLRCLRDQRVNWLEPGDRLMRELRCELAHRIGRRFDLWPLVAEKRLGGTIDVGASDFPLIQDLQRGLAGTMPRVGLAPRHALARRARDPRRLRRYGRTPPRIHFLCVSASVCRCANCATTPTISIAAAAASQPLFDGPSPARSIASSTEFVVRTPNAMGTPVAAAPAVKPLATAEA